MVASWCVIACAALVLSSANAKSLVFTPTPTATPTTPTTNTQYAASSDAAPQSTTSTEYSTATSPTAPMSETTPTDSSSSSSAELSTSSSGTDTTALLTTTMIPWVEDDDEDDPLVPSTTTRRPSSTSRSSSPTPRIPILTGSYTAFVTLEGDLNNIKNPLLYLRAYVNALSRRIGYNVGRDVLFWGLSSGSVRVALMMRTLEAQAVVQDAMLQCECLSDGNGLEWCVAGDCTGEVRQKESMLDIAIIVTVLGGGSSLAMLAIMIILYRGACLYHRQQQLNRLANAELPTEKHISGEIPLTCDQPPVYDNLSLGRPPSYVEPDNNSIRSGPPMYDLPTFVVAQEPDYSDV